MGIKIGAYLILGTLNVLLLVLVGYIASTEPGIFRFQDVVFLGIAFIAVFLEMFTTYRIIKLLNKRISEPAHKLKIALEEYYRSGEMAINAEEYPREYEQPVELINRLINTVENFKIQNKGIKERENETIVGLEKELRIQKEATLKVLQEIDEEKEVSQANAQELKKFQLAVEEASDHILITDSEGLILYTNPAGEQLTGYTIDEMIGSHAGMSWGEKVNEDEYRELWDILKGGKRMFAGEITNMRKDGSTYVAQLTITPIFDEDDPSKVIFFVSIQRDITKAKEIDRMKTEFISLASHQLRAPLAAVRWNLETLRDGIAGELNSEQMEFTKEAYDSTTRMVDLVNGLLNVSRMESGRLVIEPQPTNIEELVDTVVKEVRVLANEKGQSISVFIDDRIPIINLDPKLIRNVYLNFLTNAIKYTPNSGIIKVNVQLNREEIISSVSDNGYGIPQKDQDKIFKKFFRADNIRKHDTDGTGLGLYLVKSVVEASNGKVWFESQEDKGTTFYFTLPLAGMKAKEGEVSLEG